MKKQERAFFDDKKMTNEEIKEFFQKKASQKSSFDVETQRLLKEIEDFKTEWIEKKVNRFLDSEAGQKFIKDHEEQNPDEVFEILLKHSNIGELFNKALKKKIDELRGAIE